MEKVTEGGGLAHCLLGQTPPRSARLGHLGNRPAVPQSSCGRFVNRRVVALPPPSRIEHSWHLQRTQRAGSAL